MNIAGSTNSLYTTARLHTPGCSCSLCSPAPVDTASKLEEPGKLSTESTRVKLGSELSSEEEQQIAKLRARDRQVRQHEQAHMAAAAGLAVSAPSYTYQRGPDGVSYAIGGEVSIDVSPGRTPEETLEKAQQIERAALAPKDPSGQDQAVAAQARQMAQEARIELSTQDKEEAGAANADPASTASASAQQDDTRSNRASRAYAAQQSPTLQPSLISAYA
ncbi:putative metalloprotease CJM1_0395 family protein [Chitinimonas sp. BJYL2]|uniref:putative metalloprotease CJM1_0395 family protein n=1 Tax=Chitinimonas sp. BJYL2 TaxID=2976696 RepID=UPI0022B4BC6F|nr:putative metalloprotease CJM1_0395 family protein [Chitinimonas sp. BJYL2]